jgi:alkyl sulfatase BDS1-like metallo-beta-lactamase superfamily hydrolase
VFRCWLLAIGPPLSAGADAAGFATPTRATLAWRKIAKLPVDDGLADLQRAERGLITLVAAHCRCRGHVLFDQDAYRFIKVPPVA